jgi:ribonuclease R
MIQGTIANINNNYVILNDKRFIEQTELVNKLLPGDIVEYEITKSNTICILQINSRTPQIILGIVKKVIQKEKLVELFYPGFPKKFSLNIDFYPNVEYSDEYKIGNIIILQITQDSCKVLQKYDSIQDRTNDKNIILQLYKLNANISNLYPTYKTLIGKNMFTDEYQDLTHLNTFNVDPENSKDFDDAISLDESKNTIYVHIVDAHEQIIPSSSIDVRAFLSSFTLYLPEHIENILPKEYAENKLSLIKNEIRKTITFEYIIDPETQNIVNYKIYKSSIIIKTRYNYGEFNKIIHEFPILLSFHEKWKRKTMNIPHIKMNIHPETCKLTNYWFETNNDFAHKIIETLMILTNITISKHAPNIIPQRYHSKIKSEFIVENYFDNEIINAIFSIKKYRPAVYDATQEGHFGLGISSYTHFTSPIRRYFDVIIHRLLSGVEYENLEIILQHINKREVYIEKIVKLYENLKILSFLERDLTKIWKGYIINKKTGGYIVLLEDLLYEIFIFDKNCNLSEKDIVKVKINSIKWHQLEVKAIILT